MTVTACSLVAMAIASMIRPVWLHGWMAEPPARSSMWLAGFDTPKNYNHHQLNCGGREHFSQLGGKCGLCGDPFDGVRQNEAGGLYATGTISRMYRQGEVIPIRVELTQTHGGFFEFSLCANNDVNKAITQECLDEHVLVMADDRTVTRFSDIPFGGYVVPRALTVTINYQLPADLTCQQCVLQWKYTTAHNPGLRYQEEFYGCSDIAIYPPGVTTPAITTRSSSPSAATTTTTMAPTSTRAPPTTTTTTATSTTAKTTKITTTSLKPPPPTPSVATTTTTTSSGLSFDQLYLLCRAKGVLDRLLTGRCRKVCVVPSSCLRTFCNEYCVRLGTARQ